MLTARYQNIPVQVLDIDTTIDRVWIQTLDGSKIFDSGNCIADAGWVRLADVDVVHATSIAEIE